MPGQSPSTQSRDRLVGREAELAVLRDALSAAAAGTPRAVIIAGEAGIGKTRLVRELAASARSEGVVVTVGGCSPASGARLPYGPVTELLDRLARQLPELSTLVSASTWRALAPLRMEAPDTETDSPLASTRLFAAVADLLDNLGRDQPVIMIIEDVHWIDPASMDLLAFTARRLRHGRVLLLITVRPEGSRTRAPERVALAELRRLPNVLGIELGPLSNEALHELIDSISDSSPELRQRAASLSQGIPFFALHLAQHPTNDVPPQLRDVLVSSIEQLSDDQRSLLVLLSVVGAGDDPELLGLAVGRSQDRLAAACRDLVRRGLLMIDQQTVTLRHALLREVIVADTLPSERVVAHRLAATHLLSCPAAEQPHRAGQLAHHLLESGQHDAALGYALKAARHATSIWAHQDARDYYAAVERLWRIVVEPESVTGARQVTVWCESASAHRWCGRLDDALIRLTTAESLARTAHDRARIAQIRGQVLWAAGDMPGSVRAYQTGVDDLAADVDDELRASLLAALAQGSMATGRARSARDLASQAVALAGTVGADRTRLHASITSAAALAQLGAVEASVAALESLLPEVRVQDDLELVLRCYGNLTFALGVGCRYEELAAAAAAGLEAAGRYGPVVSLASTLVSNQVNALVAIGRWDEACQTATEALADLTAESIAGHLRASLAEVAVARGDRAAAEEQWHAARAAGSQNPYVAYALALSEAEQHLWEHDPAAASTTLAEVLPQLRAQDDVLPLLEACWLAARAAADQSETTIPRRRASTDAGTDVADLTAAAHRAADGTTLPVCSAVLLAVDAEADRVHADDRSEQWRAAADANAALGRRYVQAYCLFRSATAALRRQARTQAETSLRIAYQLATSLRAEPLLVEIVTLARIGGLSLEPEAPARDPSVGAAAPLGLTPREREVLALLTTGATNRVIARSLFISERTASVHVSNILAKLGVANRTEAARVALQTPGLDSPHEGGG